MRSSTESLSEVPLLQLQLFHPDDVRVLPGRWQHSREEPWPPIKAVKDAKIWTEAKYQALRQGLLKPSIDPQVALQCYCGLETSLW